MIEITPEITAVQYRKEFFQLLELYKRLAPKCVVEVGSFKGGSLYYWLQNAQPGAQVVSVDLGPEFWPEADQGFDKSIWTSWVPQGVHLHIINGNSRDPDVVQYVREICPKVDFLFIDGDHSYEGVKADYENYGALVRRGGLIAFHDVIRDPRVEVWRLFADFKRKGLKTRIFTSKPGQTRMGIGVLYK